MNHVDIKSRKAELDGNYCLVLTSNSVEKAAVKQVAGKSLQVWVDQITSGAYLSLIGGALALHISGESGISKERSIGRIANAFLRNASMPKPRLVLLVGFCWRNPALVMDKALIISAQVCCANLRSATDGALAARMTWPQSALALDEHQEHRILADLAAAGIADACIGPIASAETLFQDSALRDELIAAHPALLGGEMEAFSFIAPGIPWLVVKAASDAGGDDFDRAKQEASAKLAASAIAPLLTSFAQDESIASEDRQRSESLRDLIDGGVIQFDARHHRIDDLNDLLEEVLAPQLESRFRRYLSPAGYGPEVIHRCVDALLELTQNAVRHGKANRITIKFEATGVIYIDDGDGYDSRALPSRLGRGGVRAIERLLSDETSGTLVFTPLKQAKGNGYRIELPQASAVLAAARQSCTARIRKGVVGVPYGRREVLDIPAGCTTLYVDTTNMRMSSRKFTLAEEIARLVDDGKTVYLGCSNADDVMFFKDELRASVGSRVIVFLDASLPSNL